MITNIDTLKNNNDEAARQAELHEALYASSQEMRLKTEAELLYTKRRLQTLSRLYEQSCKEIFTLRQQLHDMQQAAARLRISVP